MICCRTVAVSASEDLLLRAKDFTIEIINWKRYPDQLKMRKELTRYYYAFSIACAASEG